jgi:aerobic carbon-monoxide dehydrogenase small subunit
MIVTLTVNGEPRTAEVAGFESLLWVLRERLGLRGAKDACQQGECGSCCVLLDGELVCACLVLAADAEGLAVTTVEGLGDASAPHPVQEAFVEHGAVQCGFCTPGLVVTVAHLLATQPDATPDDVREALAGNLCRCTGYGAILRATSALLAGDGAGGGTDGSGHGGEVAP